ncbi:tripartite tricarboxylate transporter substrate binding protein [Belnapia sp. T6]|uniref:Tripartite tricarboxylate transporter substrate binding protein n=1 Tax=Belnapia mucosa TaxID=2804532 RepID=A0ABS1VCY7_9PROT|nr:tripartite tricarboxylate transporter substrate binding protein [Belnapia mucosa]MBL6459508.1 tripartite tricarboxylate transporter substrate binding protein [Belnapia mucosa]
MNLATTRRALLGAAALAPLARPALAQNGWRASRPIRMLIPFPPGGATDIIARMLAQQMGDRLGASLVVDNRPGANGIVASQALLGQPADGHTLIMGTGDTHTILPLAHKRLPYDIRDFTAVAPAATVVFTVAVRQGLPVNDVQGLLALARSSAQAGQPLTYASYGVGSASQVAGETFKQLTGVNLLHVPYQGAGPAILAVSANQVDVTFVPLAVSGPQKASVKILAVCTDQRFETAPDLPTLRESGVALTADTWIGLLAHAKTPPEVLDTINAVVRRVTQSPEFLDALRTNAFTPLNLDRAAWAAYLSRESEKLGAIVREAGIQFEG